jgi:carboxymethylenebutenolidase
VDLIELPTSAGPAEAYVARPAESSGEEPHPGVLFFMDAIGLRPRIAGMADRIASWGYVVLVPNVFHRDGSVAQLAPKGDLRAGEEREAFMSGAMTRVRALTVELAVPDLADYLAALRRLPGVPERPVAAVGYCMGARLALRAAALDDGVAAVGCFHGGGLVTDAPDSPHLGLDQTRARFVFGHADGDRSMPPEAVAALGDALELAGLDAVNEVYEGAAHGYTMADTSAYNEAATERHFAMLRRLLVDTLPPA